MWQKQGPRSPGNCKQRSPLMFIQWELQERSLAISFSSAAEKTTWLHALAAATAGRPQIPQPLMYEDYGTAAALKSNIRSFFSKIPTVFIDRTSVGETQRTQPLQSGLFAPGISQTAELICCSYVGCVRSYPNPTKEKTPNPKQTHPSTPSSFSRPIPRRSHHLRAGLTVCHGF